MARARIDDHRTGEHLFPTTISTSGVVTPGEQQRAVEAMSAALSDIDEPIRRCVLRLEHRTDPHHIRHATARFSVDLDGTRLHAHGEGETLSIAIDQTASRLHERLRRYVDRAKTSRRNGMSLRDLDEELRSPVPTFERGDDEREVVSRVPFGPLEATLDEAAFDLDALGYDFHLFVETETDDDAVIRRNPDGPGVIVQYASEPPAAIPTGTFEHVEIDGRPVPELDVGEARGMLHLSDYDYVFFRDLATGRGSVVYRRYDGHDGFITTAH